MLELYKNIKKRRIELNMSQQELAEAVGYKGKSMISQVEKGGVDLPESMIVKFADALYTTPATLLGFENVRIDPVSGYPVYDDDEEDNTAFGFADVETYPRIDKIHLDSLDDLQIDMFPFQKYSQEHVQKAMELYDLFQKATPEIRTAVETILKAQNPDKDD